MFLDLQRNDLTQFTNISLPELKRLDIRSCLDLTVLDISNLPKLTYLNTNSNYKINTLSFDLNPLLDSLYLWNNNLGTIDLSTLSNLRFLDIGDIEITELDVSQNTLLEDLYCNNNLLTSLELSTNTRLKTIHCFLNELTSLILPSTESLLDLDCDNNKIENLDLCGNLKLKKLHCSGNLLSEVNISCLDSLEEIFCFSNQIEEIIFGENPALRQINAFANQMSELNISDTLKIESINISDNKFTEFNPNRFPNMTSVNCNGNFLTQIDLSRSNIDWVSLNNNLITQIDVSNLYKLKLLHCNNNPLHSLNLKNGTDNELINLWITGLDSLKYICVDENEISRIADLVEIFGYDCAVSTYCNFNPGGDYGIFNASMRYDIKQNQCTNESTPLEYHQFELKIGNYTSQHISNSLGYVSIPLEEGSYTITPNVENIELFQINPDTAFYNYPIDSSYVLQEFCISPIEVFDDLDVKIYPLEEAIPGFSTKYKIIVNNKGTTINSGKVVLSFPSNLMNIENSNKVYTETDDKITWEVDNLTPFESVDIVFYMLLNSPMDNPPLNANDTLFFKAEVSPEEMDMVSENNASILSQIVVNSFDPNDKTCLQGEVLMDTLIGTKLEYIIRFENLGTAPATNIVVKDFLQSYAFDVSSLRVLDSSHEMFTRVKGEIVEFIFEEINLPFEDDLNDGYVIFSANTQETLLANDTIRNNAEIYFDFNFPIITNTYETVVATDQDGDGYNSTIDCDDTNNLVYPGAAEIANNGIDEDCDGMDLTSGIHELANTFVRIYPNPVVNRINIQVGDTLNYKVSLFDVNGKLILSNINLTTIDVNQYSNGIYLLEMRDLKTGHKVVEKLVIH